MRTLLLVLLGGVDEVARADGLTHTVPVPREERRGDERRIEEEIGKEG
jgi:hypothetical protein